MLRLIAFLPFVLFAACQVAPQPEDEAALSTSDTTVTEGPFYDPDETRAGWETQTRNVLLQSADVQEAQALRAGETIRVSVVMSERPDDTALAQRAEQFAAAAQREVEPEAASTPDAMLAETRHTYQVTIRDTEGNTIYFGEKAPTTTTLQSRDVADAPAAPAAAPNAAPNTGDEPRARVGFGS